MSILCIIAYSCWPRYYMLLARLLAILLDCLLTCVLPISKYLCV